MNAPEYKKRRQLSGTQTEVAAQLGVRQATISDRENGVSPITREAWLALCALPKKKGKCH